MGGALRYAKMMFKSTQFVVQPTGTDARPGPFLAQADEAGADGDRRGRNRAGGKLVAGRAMRATTNPELAKRDILYYSNATSCGTATATSLPCMFSPLTMAEYSYEGGLRNENLLDVLAHAGFKVEWWDNNTGDKDIGDRMPDARIDDGRGRGRVLPAGMHRRGVPEELCRRRPRRSPRTPRSCCTRSAAMGQATGCAIPPDREIFAPGLQDAGADRLLDAKRSSTPMTTPSPTPTTFLAQVIDQLDAQDRVIPAMFYVSDHGESLGEGGLYLHGTPYFMAPDVPDPCADGDLDVGAVP